jgi:hypothetical protein
MNRTREIGNQANAGMVLNRFAGNFLRFYRVSLCMVCLLQNGQNFL